MWGHVKYELKTRAAPLYAARDRETANTTNKTHPSPASRPHVPRLPERLRPLGGEALRQRADAEHGAHARSHHQPSAPGQDHHASVLLALASTSLLRPGRRDFGRTGIDR